MDLSVLIPARKEEWLGRTIQDVLEHATAETEVIAVLDGDWPLEPIAQHPRVQIVRVPQSIGQRAATNLAARISRAKYVMKLDAHCSMAQGFDRVLIDAAAELGDDVTQIPAQTNLHAFDWLCDACGHRAYQGPTPKECEKCQAPSPRRDIIWKPRESRRTTSWRFDTEPKFQYWREDQKRQQGDICDVMTSLGACFFMSRARYWQLGGLDEAHGSWGSFGIEIALKSWLSGGRHVVNKRTQFSHLFRTQGGDFGFPYPISGAAQERAREHCRQLWFNNAWPGQVRPLKWLLEKFSPPDWTPEKIAALPDLPPSVAAPAMVTAPRVSAGVLYYSDCRPDAAVLEASRRSIAASGLPIVAVTLKPMDWPAAMNVVLPAERGTLTMFRQILIGLKLLETDVVFFAEHDVVYTPEHFQFRPPARDRYYYQMHVWKVDAESGRAVTYDTKQTSQLCADRLLLIEHYRKRIARVEVEGFSRRMGFEPGSHNRPERVDDVTSDTWRLEVPNIDLRHAHNLTPTRWSRDAFRSQKNCQGWQEAESVPGWGRTVGRMHELLKGQAAHG